jgi:hypothetical protein
MRRMVTEIGNLRFSLPRNDVFNLKFRNTIFKMSALSKLPLLK